MKSHKEMKSDHAFRSVVTEQDERHYREPKPLTDSQKDAMLQQVEDIKRLIAIRDNKERAWIERHYADTELRDHYNH